MRPHVEGRGVCVVEMELRMAELEQRMALLTEQDELLSGVKTQSLRTTLDDEYIQKEGKVIFTVDFGTKIDGETFTP